MKKIYDGHTPAERCLASARKLMVEDDTVRYACLELRLAIEHLVLDQLKAYLQELPDDALKKWAPREVIGELLSVDDSAQGTATYFVYGLNAEGIEDGSPIPIGVDRRMNMKWANRAHSALSNFLHAPTLGQLEEGKNFDPVSARTKATEIAGQIEDLLSSSPFRANFGTFLEFDCGLCNRHIRRRSSSIPPEGITCPNKECRAQYSVTRADETHLTYRLKQRQFQCVCTEPFYIAAHQVEIGTIVVCPACERRYVVGLTLGFLNKTVHSAPAEQGEE